MERRSERSDSTPRSEAIGDARLSLALWLRAGRTRRGLSVDDVAKVTKIQPRILERLETGQLDGLPADVFVRGFVRSFARCVGLEESEALRRYAACNAVAVADAARPATAMGSSDITTTARALVEAMAPLVPGSANAVRATPRAMHAMEIIDLASGSLRDLAAAPAGAGGLEDAKAAGASTGQGAPASTGPSKKKRGRRKGRDKRGGGPRFAREMAVVGTPSGASPIVAGEPAPRPLDAIPEAAKDAVASDPPPVADREPTAAAPDGAAISDEPIATATWAPTMPPAAAAPSVPWRRPAYAAVAAAAAPTLVIDDADPESAERVLEERAEKQAPRRSFLPPILLDREDRSARQGGLTLAVIILLIAATLTLSYLMRRPSASGDGMTRAETSGSDLG